VLTLQNDTAVAGLRICFPLGSAAALDAPVRQTFVAELVGDEYLTNAVALNSTSFNAARMIGPALAGLLIARIGTVGRSCSMESRLPRTHLDVAPARRRSESKSKGEPERERLHGRLSLCLAQTGSSRHPRHARADRTSA